MVRCDRLSIPDAYIIEKITETRWERRDRSGLNSPGVPTYDAYDWPEQPEQDDDNHCHVIIIEL